MGCYQRHSPTQGRHYSSKARPLEWTAHATDATPATAVALYNKHHMIECILSL